MFVSDHHRPRRRSRRKPAPLGIQSPSSREIYPAQYNRGVRVGALLAIACGAAFYTPRTRPCSRNHSPLRSTRSIQLAAHEGLHVGRERDHPASRFQRQSRIHRQRSLGNRDPVRQALSQNHRARPSPSAPANSKESSKRSIAPWRNSKTRNAHQARRPPGPGPEASDQRSRIPERNARRLQLSDRRPGKNRRPRHLGIPAQPNRITTPSTATPRLFKRSRAASGSIRANFSGCASRRKPPASFPGGGFLARLDPGASLALEQTRVNDEIWLPRREFLSGAGRRES